MRQRQTEKNIHAEEVGRRKEGGHGEKEEGRMVREDEMRDDEEQGVKGKG